MVLSSALRYAYNKLYVQMRKYLWDMDVVEQLAELEIECYKAVPSIQTLRSRFTTLYTNIRLTVNNDEEFKVAVDYFRNMIESADEIVSKLDKVREEFAV